MAGFAAHSIADMRLVVEVNEIGHIVNANPGQRL
jgi:hypothetical protein